MSLEESGSLTKWGLIGPKPGAKYVDRFMPASGYYIEEAYIFVDDNDDIYVKAVMREYHHFTGLGYLKPKTRKRTLKFHKDGCYLSYRGNVLFIRNLDEIVSKLLALKLVERQVLELLRSGRD